MSRADAAPSVPPASERFFEGQLISNKYRLVRPLDEGGMGVVWVAHNEDLDRPVAIKLIRTESQSPEAVKRLTSEARILARLGHPSILQVFDFGKTDHGDPFIVMELLHGQCLDAALYQRHKFDAQSAVQLLLPIADGLAVAHDRGIVHRDLKPANIFLAQTLAGRVQPKILDFGIAQVVQAQDLRITKEGALMGSPVYMSPEQARGNRDVDQRADIWAFCVVLYEAVTGNLPFDGDNYNAVLRAIIETEPEPTTVQCAGDPVLWSIIQRGLMKRPEHRWQSVRELGTALAQWLLGHGIAEDISRASLYATWLSPESEHVSSFPPVTLPHSHRSPLHSSPDAITLSGIDTPDLPVRALARSPRTGRLSTGGHGAVALRTTSGPRSSWTTKLAVAASIAGGLGVGALLWTMARPGVDATPPPATGAVAAPSVNAPVAAQRARPKANQQPSPKVTPVKQGKPDDSARTPKSADAAQKLANQDELASKRKPDTAKAKAKGASQAPAKPAGAPSRIGRRAAPSKPKASRDDLKSPW